jgi:hypothetical protein
MGGNMFAKSGSKVPNLEESPSEGAYLAEILQALRDELGAAGAATKTIMRRTGALDRTARYWMSVEARRSGYHLIYLARESNSGLAAGLNSHFPPASTQLRLLLRRRWVPLKC